MRFVILGFILAWLVPVWVIAIVIVLLFMHGATRKPTPKRRKR